MRPLLWPLHAAYAGVPGAIHPMSSGDTGSTPVDGLARPTAAALHAIAPVDHPDRLVTLRGHRGVVGDQHQRHVELAHHSQQQFQHGGAGLGVERAGGLVGQQQGRRTHERAVSTESVGR